MPDLRSLSRMTMRGHPVIPLDSAEASHVSGFCRNDNRKVFNRQVNKISGAKRLKTFRQFHFSHFTLNFFLSGSKALEARPQFCQWAQQRQ